MFDNSVPTIQQLLGERQDTEGAESPKAATFGVVGACAPETELGAQVLPFQWSTRKISPPLVSLDAAIDGLSPTAQQDE